MQDAACWAAPCRCQRRQQAIWGFVNLPQTTGRSHERPSAAGRAMEVQPEPSSSGRPPSHPSDRGLDFYSPSFDPLRALLTAGLLPPVPAARPLDAVYHCRQLLPADHPDAWREQHRAAKSKEAAEAAERGKSRVSAVQQRQQRQQTKLNPIDEIAGSVRDGPLLLLKKCYQERRRVSVVTRHARGVRGTSVGTLVAFDKHMNMVLRDVEERYTVLLTLQRPRPPAPGSGEARTRWARRQEHRHRQLRQVFVRGDSVVLVAAAAAAPPGSAAEAAAGAAASGYAQQAAGAGREAAEGSVSGQAAGPGRRR